MTITFQQSLENVAALVKYFQINQATFLAASFIGASARKDLIDPFFIALGWDVNIGDHVPQDYQYVLMEEGRPIVEGRQRINCTGMAETTCA
jgi:hypothetical protein